jgi:hypothetical protein
MYASRFTSGFGLDSAAKVTDVFELCVGGWCGWCLQVLKSGVLGGMCPGYAHVVHPRTVCRLIVFMNCTIVPL